MNTGTVPQLRHIAEKTALCNSTATGRSVNFTDQKVKSDAADHHRSAGRWYRPCTYSANDFSERRKSPASETYAVVGGCINLKQGTDHVHNLSYRPFEDAIVHYIFFARILVQRLKNTTLMYREMWPRS